jgi:hypothetical protein|tara:strand:+ start:511 stop:951 length:441 start_codon:yes stop_codon:yes gene_type:complete
MIKWIFIIVAVIATLSLNGCAKDATAEDSMATTPTETSTETTTNSTSSDKEWIAVVLTWRPVIYTIDKEFTSEVDCWNYYDTGVGESKMLNSYGTQVLDHQGNKPDKEYMKKHRPAHREYPTRMYKNHGGWMVWLTCDIKGRSEGL